MSRKKRIYNVLFEAIKPDTLIVEDESHGHSVPIGAETHYKVVVVSTQFINLTRIARHRLINTLLADEFSTGLHALSLHLYTPDEWQKQDTGAPASPACQHASDD